MKTGQVFYGWRMVGAAVFIQLLLAALLQQSFGAYVAVLVDERGWSKTALSGAAALQSAESALIEYFRATSARNILIFTTVLTAFASAIAVGVVYNSARIALAERAWELATLRVLGFEHREVAALLLGELALEMALALPLGFVAGAWLARAMTGMMASENFTMPTVILPSTFAYAGLTMFAAGAACAWLVQRRLAGLDLVAVLKTRE